MFLKIQKPGIILRILFMIREKNTPYVAAMSVSPVLCGPVPATIHRLLHFHGTRQGTLYKQA
jgi:hypothetical protein